MVQRSCPASVVARSAIAALAATAAAVLVLALASAALAVDLRAGPVLKGHEGAVRCMAFSRDATLVATGGDDASARVWEVASGKALAVLEGHAGRIDSVAFSPDAKLLAVGAPGEIVVWDLAARKRVRAYRSDGEDLSVAAFVPDGKALAFAHSWARNASRHRTLRLVDFATDQVLVEDALPGGRVQMLRACADHRALFGFEVSGSGYNPMLIGFDAATGKRVAHESVVVVGAGRVPSQAIVGFAPEVFTLDVADDGSRVAAAQGDLVEVVALRWSEGSVRPAARTQMKLANGRFQAVGCVGPRHVIATTRTRQSGDETLSMLDVWDLSRTPARVLASANAPAGGRFTALAARGRRLAVAAGSSVALFDVAGEWPAADPLAPAPEPAPAPAAPESPPQRAVPPVPGPKADVAKAQWTADGSADAAAGADDGAEGAVRRAQALTALVAAHDVSIARLERRLVHLEEERDALQRSGRLSSLGAIEANVAAARTDLEAARQKRAEAKLELARLRSGPAAP